VVNQQFMLKGTKIDPFGRGLSPHLTQSCLGRGLSPYQVASESIQPFGHNEHWPKIGDPAPPPFTGGGAGSPSIRMSRKPRPTSIPSGVLIHAALWPQQIWAENGRRGCAPFGVGELGPHLTQCVRGQGLPACQVSSWSIQPFGHSAPTLQTDRTGQTRDR